MSAQATFSCNSESVCYENQGGYYSTLNDCNASCANTPNWNGAGFYNTQTDFYWDTAGCSGSHTTGGFYCTWVGVPPTCTQTGPTDYMYMRLLSGPWPDVCH